MADLLGILDRLAQVPPARPPELSDRLAMYEQAVVARCAALREQLEAAGNFAARLHQAWEAPRGREKNRR